MRHTYSALSIARRHPLLFSRMLETAKATQVNKPVKQKEKN